MLCVSRYANQAVVLLLPDGRRIVVTVLEISRSHGRGVRIGIDAPEDVSIYRAELRPDHAVRQRIDAPPQKKGVHVGFCTCDGGCPTCCPEDYAPAEEPS